MQGEDEGEDDDDDDDDDDEEGKKKKRQKDGLGADDETHETTQLTLEITKMIATKLGIDLSSKVDSDELQDIQDAEIDTPKALKSASSPTPHEQPVTTLPESKAPIRAASSTDPIAASRGGASAITSASLQRRATAGSTLSQEPGGGVSASQQQQQQVSAIPDGRGSSASAKKVD